MKRFIITITLLAALVGSAFAESHNKKFEKGAAICQQIAQDYNIEVEVKKVSALPGNAVGVCMKKGDGKYVIKMNWNYLLGMTDNLVTPVLIHEMAHAVTDNCGHNEKWVSAIFDLVDYFPYLNSYEAYILNQEVAKEE
jgi:hypothetical protein